MSKLSKFLKTNGLNALSKAAQGNPIGVITSLFGLTGENTEVGILNALKSNSEALSILKEKELEYVRVITDDRNSARRMQIDINNSEKASWITRNAAAIIALLWVGFSMYLYWMSLRGVISEDQQMNVSIISSINNITMLIVGYYFGSSDKRKG